MLSLIRLDRGTASWRMPYCGGQQHSAANKGDLLNVLEHSINSLNIVAILH